MYLLPLLILMCNIQPTLLRGGCFPNRNVTLLYIHLADAFVHVQCLFSTSLSFFYYHIGLCHDIILIIPLLNQQSCVSWGREGQSCPAAANALCGKTISSGSIGSYIPGVHPSARAKHTGKMHTPYVSAGTCTRADAHIRLQ